MANGDDIDLSAGLQPKAGPAGGAGGSWDVHPAGGASSSWGDEDIDLSAGMKPVGAPEEKPGVVSRSWEWLNRPRISPDKILQLTQRATGGDPNLTVAQLREDASRINPEDSWWKNYGRSALEGMGASAAEQLAPMVSSPLGFATMIGAPFLKWAGGVTGATKALQATRAGQQALRAAHTAELGTSAGFGAQGLHNAYEAAVDPREESLLERAANVGGGIGQGILGGAGVAGSYRESFVPTGIDAINRLTAPVREAAAGRLNTSASEQMQRVMLGGGGTRENKQKAASVAPEMAEQGIMGWTRKGLHEKVSAKAEEIGQQLEDEYAKIKPGTTIPTQPILDYFEQSKQRFMGSGGQVNDQAAIDRIDDLKQVVQQYGPDATVDDLLKLKRLWDKQVSAGKGFYGKTVAEGAALDAKREAAGAIRDELAKQYPDIDKINKQYHFWAKIRDVLGATIERKSGQAQPIGETAYTIGGFLKGGPKVAAALAALRKVMTSTAWSTFSAAAKARMARMLADGNVVGAANVISGGAGPTGPVVGGIPPTGGGASPAGTPPASNVPPWTGAGQAPIQFTGGTNVPAQATPPVPPSTAPPTPNLPLFRQAQAPAPEPVAPEVAPEAGESGLTTGPLPPKYEPLTPPFANAGQAKAETPKPAPAAAPRTPQQQGAIDQAITHANNGVHDIETHAPLREQAYRPDLEPENWRGPSTEKNREGQHGLSTKELNAPDGKYTPEVQKRHQQQVEQILGPDTGEAEEHPVVIIQGGGAASGKSEAIGKALQKKYPGIAVSDSDLIKFGSKDGGFNGGAVQGMPEAETLKQSDPLGAAARLHEESSDISKMVAKEALRRGQSIILDGVGGNVEKLKAQIQEFKQAGYRVEVHYADRDVNEALKSMTHRFKRTQRWVPPDVMVDGHRKAANAFAQVAGLPEVDESSLSMAKPSGSKDLGAGKYDVVYRNGKIENEGRWAEHRQKGGHSDGRNGLQGRGLDGEGLRGTEGSRTAGQGEAGAPVRQAGPEHPAPASQEVAPAGLHIADNAPPKDKPVTLIYGGAFNPAHEGHIAAVQEAHDQLTNAGYTVDRILVAPTADKLLANKLGENRLPVEDRANIAQTQFPKEINGTPVEVSTGPAAEVEAKQGKPRRTDLADFGQRERPGHTVINVAGDDAAVPGSPEHKGPKLYQGAPGSNHEGYYYLETPRIGDISSSKVRAALTSGEKIPGMNPEAARVYREAHAKQQAGKAPAEPTLPGMEHVPAERAQAAAEEQGRLMTEQMTEPPRSVESAAGEMERNSPLFRGTEASPQNEMFGTPQRGVPPPGEVGRVPVSDLNVDPHRFQYKANTDTQGVSTLLKETKKWNPDLAGVISVWTDPANGQTYVVNGHHRFELAKRLGVQEMVVRHLNAGTAEEARATGALQNIAEGRGTALDAAKFFRDSGTTPEDLKAKGISLGEATARDGMALSQLEPSIFQRVVNGDLKPGRAIAIGEAGLDHAQQKSIVESIEKRERSGKNVTDGTVSELIRLEKGAGKTSETQTDLFGSQQIERSLGFEKAEVSDYIKQQMAREKRTFGFVSKGGRAQELARGGNVIDVERSGAISSGAAQAEEVYNKLSARGGPISDILNQAARKLADGENAGTVKSEAYNQIRQAISETLGGSQGPNAGRPEGAS